MSFTISSNPQVNPLANVTLSSKGVFIDKCNTASKFNRLDAMGNQLDTLYILFLFLSLFLMIAMFVITQDKVDPITKQEIPKTTMDKLLGYVKQFTILLFVVMLSYSGYRYIAYLYEYYAWFGALSTECKTGYLAIKSLDSIMTPKSSAPTNPNSSTFSLNFSPSSSIKV